MTSPNQMPDPTTWFDNQFINGATMKANVTDPYNTFIAGLADSGWVRTGYTAQSPATVTQFAIRSIGPIVYITATGVVGSSIPASTTGDFTNIPLFTLPSAFVPSQVGQTVSEGGVGPIFLYVVGTSGLVQLAAGPPLSSALPSSTQYTIAGTYFLG